MNILVTGAKGQLGTHMLLSSANSRHRYFFTDVDELDITDPVAIRQFVIGQQIDAIVNCAAYTNVDRAETDEILADKINHLAVGYLADTMASTGGLLIHISTDYVFGGNKNNTPCGEDEPANPTGVYGSTKLQGEQAVVASGCRYLLFRTSWLYSEYGKNFCKTMLSLSDTKPKLTKWVLRPMQAIWRKLLLPFLRMACLPTKKVSIIIAMKVCAVGTILLKK